MYNKTETEAKRNWGLDCFDTKALLLHNRPFGNHRVLQARQCIGRLEDLSTFQVVNAIHEEICFHQTPVHTYTYTYFVISSI